jgi:hypothetical protein
MDPRLAVELDHDRRAGSAQVAGHGRKKVPGNLRRDLEATEGSLSFAHWRRA